MPGKKCYYVSPILFSRYILFFLSVCLEIEFLPLTKNKYAPSAMQELILVQEVERVMTAHTESYTQSITHLFVELNVVILKTVYGKQGKTIT